MMISKDKDGCPIDLGAILATETWITMLAAPHLYACLQRSVDPAYLVQLMDYWVAYVDRGDRYSGPMFAPVPYEQRPALARKLRSLLATWTPPELPAEITETARALLFAEGFEPNRGTGWEDYTFPNVDEKPMDDIVIWPERFHELLLKPGDDPSKYDGGSAIMKYYAGEKDPEKGYCEVTYLEPWNRGWIVGWRVVPSPTGALPENASYGDVYAFLLWLMVLSAPHLYRQLGRRLEQAHWLRLVKTYMAYASSQRLIIPKDLSNQSALRPYERKLLARKHRALLESWTPPELPKEITEAARELVEAEGIYPPGTGWDDLKHEKPCPLDDILLWPEGIPLVLRDRAENGGRGRT